jgi:transposase
MQTKDGRRMLAWIEGAASSAHTSIARFAQGLRRDLKAVIAAVESSFSSGQVEGQVNRLKALKRQMYGRAGFSLLRARVLPFSLSVLDLHQMCGRTHFYLALTDGNSETFVLLP